MIQKSIVAVLAVVLLALAPGDARGEDGDGGPRPGKYRIHSYGATSAPPLYLGHVILEKGGAYKVFLPGDKAAGEGRYEYDPQTKTVRWKDGPYKTWGGVFTVEREGKTHKIRLKRTTVATNSTDSNK